MKSWASRADIITTGNMCFSLCRRVEHEAQIVRNLRTISKQLATEIGATAILIQTMFQLGETLIIISRNI